MTARRRQYVLRIRVVRLGILVKEFQILRSSVNPSHPQRTTNGNGNEIDNGKRQGAGVTVSNSNEDDLIVRDVN